MRTIYVPKRKLYTRHRSPISIVDNVSFRVYDAQGNLKQEASVTGHNTITNWTRALLASFLVGQTINIGSGSTIQPSLPAYIALGTGTGTASITDQAMTGEVHGMRRPYTYRDVSQGYTAETVVDYATTDPNGTYTEAGLWDQDVTPVTLSANANAGAASLSLSGSSPQMWKNQQVYLSNGTNSEYVSVSTGYSAGATTWNLNSPLKYSYTTASTVIALSGNLIAHIFFQGSGVVKAQGDTVVGQWDQLINAG